MPAPWLAANQPPATGPAGVRPIARRNVGRTAAPTAAPAIPPIFAFAFAFTEFTVALSVDSHARAAVQERRITKAFIMRPLAYKAVVEGTAPPEATAGMYKARRIATCIPEATAACAGGE